MRRKKEENRKRVQKEIGLHKAVCWTRERKEQESHAAGPSSTSRIVGKSRCTKGG